MKNRKYAKSKSEATKIFKAKTNTDYSFCDIHPSGNRIYTLKHPTPTRKFFIGSYMEWLNK